MKIQTKNGDIIDFDDLTILDDTMMPIYKIWHFENDDFFKIIKVNGEGFENIDDRFMIKSSNVINVK